MKLIKWQVFLILGIVFWIIGGNTFHILGIVFLILALVRFLQNRELEK